MRKVEKHPSPCGCRECFDKDFMFWFGVNLGEEPKAECHYNQLAGMTASERIKHSMIEPEMVEIYRKESDGVTA